MASFEALSEPSKVLLASNNFDLWLWPTSRRSVTLKAKRWLRLEEIQKPQSASPSCFTSCSPLSVSVQRLHVYRKRTDASVSTLTHTSLPKETSMQLHSRLLKASLRHTEWDLILKNPPMSIIIQHYITLISFKLKQYATLVPHDETNYDNAFKMSSHATAVLVPRSWRHWGTSLRQQVSICCG